jgi:hypothetical protein
VLQVFVVVDDFVVVIMVAAAPIDCCMVIVVVDIVLIGFISSLLASHAQSCVCVCVCVFVLSVDCFRFCVCVLSTITCEKVMFKLFEHKNAVYPLTLLTHTGTCEYVVNNNNNNATAEHQSK